MTTVLTPNNRINTIDVLPSGAVRLGGFAAVFFEKDRQDDRWDPRAAIDAIEPFMAGDRALKYNHGRVPQAPGPIGEVESLEVHASGRGVWATAILPYYEPDHPYRPIFEGVLKPPRVVNAFSFGGYFTRAELPDGSSNIVGFSATELSITGTPVGYSTRAAVLGVGADPVGYDPEAQEWLRRTRRELGF